MIKPICFLILGTAYGLHDYEGSYQGATTSLRLTRKGFSMFKYHLQNNLEQSILSRTVLPFNETLDDGYTVQLEHAEVLDVSIKDLKFTFLTPNIVRQTMKRSTVTFGGKWRLNHQEINDTLTGDFDIKLENTQTTWRLSLYRANTGTLRVGLDACEFRVYRMINASVTSEKDVSLTHQVKIVQGLIKGFQIRWPEIYCTPLISPFINITFVESINLFFGRYPLRYLMDENKHLEIVYELLKPVTGDDGLDFLVCHHIYYNNTEIKIPKMYYVRMYPGDSNEYMMLFQITDDLLNAKFDADFKLGLLKKTITKSNLDKQRDLSAITCKEICVGKFSKTLAETFPNTYVYIKVSALKPFTSYTIPTGVTINAEGSVGMYIMTPSGEEKMLTKAMIYANGTILAPKIIEQKMVANVAMAKCDVTNVQSFIGDLQGDKLTKLVELVGKKGEEYLENILNERLAEGIPLPLPASLDLKGDPMFWFQDHTVTIGLNFNMDN